MKHAKNVFLQPGDTYSSRQPTIVSMALGSCISVCLHDTSLLLGGANHFVLAGDDGRYANKNFYGKHAVYKLVQEMEHWGANRRNMLASIVGGGSLLAGTRNSIGKCNIECARQCLTENNIAIFEEHVGGDYGRVLRFHTARNHLEIIKIDNKDIDSPQETASLFLRTTEYNYLKEIFAIGIGRAAAALGQLVGKHIDIAIPQILIRNLEYIENYLHRQKTPIVSIKQSLANISGKVLVVFAPQNHQWLVKSVMRHMRNTEHYTKDMERDALTEIGSIVGNACTSALGDFLGKRVQVATPELYLDLPSTATLWRDFFSDEIALQEKFAKYYGLTIKTALGIQKSEQSALLLIFPLASLHFLLQETHF